MNYLIVDDETIALEYLKSVLLEINPQNRVTTCSSPKLVVNLVKHNEFDACFLDINMDEMSGMELAAEIKKIKPKTNILFVTAYWEHCQEAFDLDASAYVMKPFTVKQIKHALDNLRYDVHTDQEDRLVIRCFGNFEVYYKGKPVFFSGSKTKELFAYLIDRRGAICSNAEIEASLWEEDGHDSYVRKMRKDIVDTLEKIGMEDIVVVSRGGMGLTNLDKIECDYYKWLEGPRDRNSEYMGEYMSQYEWAEYKQSQFYNTEYGI